MPGGSYGLLGGDAQKEVVMKPVFELELKEGEYGFLKTPDEIVKLVVLKGLLSVQREERGRG
jgi:hypothetical protein